MRRWVIVWVIVCLLAACERAGDSQNPHGTGGEIATGPTGPRAIVDASIATLPNDAAPLAIADARVAVTDAAVARADARRDRDSVTMSEIDADKFAELLAAADPNGPSDDDMSKRRPGADLGKAYGGDRTGGGGRGGTGRVGTGGKTDGPGTSSDEPRARVTVASKRANETTSLTAEILVHKVSAAYMAGIKRCYKSQLERDRTVRGRVTLTFKVVETGTITDARATGFSADIDTCLARMISSWRFPAPKDKDDAPTTASFEIVLQLVPD